MGRDFLYFLMTPDNMFYYIDHGVVMQSGTPKPLIHTPDGWLDIQIGRTRNPRYFALDRTFTLPLDFVLDGAKILKSIFYKQGFEAAIKFAISEKRISFSDDRGVPLLTEDGIRILIDDNTALLTEDVPEYAPVYTLLYAGELDFTQFSQMGTKVTVNAMEGGPSKFLKANENVVREIPFTDSIAVNMTGVRLHQKAEFLVIDNYNEIDGDKYYDGHTLALNFVSQEAITSLGAGDEQRVKASNQAQTLWPANTWFLLSSEESSSIELEWDFNMTATLAPGIAALPGTKFFLQLILLQGPELPMVINELQQIQLDPLMMYNHPINFKGTYSGNVPANHRCILYMSANLNKPFTKFIYGTDPGSLKVKYTYVYPNTVIKAFRPLTLFKALAAKNGINKVSSKTLEKYKDVVITCGDSIRRIEDAVAKTSLSDFFNAFNTILSIGMAVIKDLLVLEEKSFFVNYTEPMNLGAAKTLKVAPAQDQLYNTVKIGFPSQNYEDVNGREEFCNTHTYSLPVTRITKELNLVSPYRADCYGVEFTRINLEGKTTTDDSADNDIFLLHIEDKVIVNPGQPDHGAYNLDRSLNPYASGLLETETVFNLWLSPKQCLYRNGSFVRSCLYKADAEKITFNTTEKNSQLVVSEPDKKIVAERADVMVTDLNPQLYNPIILEIETRVPYEAGPFLKRNIDNTWLFTYDNQSFIGFPVKDSIQPATNGSQVFQMYSAPQNDLDKLIEIMD